MRRYMLSIPAIVAAALVLGQPVAAQEKEQEEKVEKTERVEKKEKAEKVEKAEKAEKTRITTNNEEIVIKRKSDKDGKVVIEMRGDDIIVNGKPLDDYDDEDIIVRKRKSSTTVYSPFRGQGGNTVFLDSDSHLFTESKTAFLGVVTEKDDKGAKIEQITDGSAADKAGLKEGDVITKIDESKIEDPDDLTKVIRKHKPEDKVGITYERNGKTERTTATLGKRNLFNHITPKFNMPDTKFEMPDMNFNWEPGTRGGGWTTTGRPRLGIKAQDTEDGKGVKVLDVAEESAAEKAGIKEDDIITEFDGKKVDNADELSKYAREAQTAQKSAVKITFNRNGKSQTVEVKTPRKLKTANL